MDGKKEGDWSVHVILVEKGAGVRNHMKVQRKVSVVVPNGAQATVQDFMKQLNGIQEHPFDTTTAMDLSPFSEAKLGHDTTTYGRGWRPGSKPNWVPENTDPRPPNCKWLPNIEEPHQKLSDAGLKDGAELAVVKVCSFRG